MGAQLPLPVLEHVANIHLDLGPALSSGSTPKGHTLFIPIHSGAITSPPSPSPTAPVLNLRVLPGGNDYPTLHASSSMLSLDVNLVAVDDATNDVFRFQNTGFITLDDDVKKLLLEGKGTGTEFGEKDIRETITCNTGSEVWGWMNFATMVAQGRFLERDGGLAGIEFRVFRVVVNGK